MATGEVVADGGSYLDRAYSAGGDALSAFIDNWRKEKDVSAQVRIIRAQGEQDRITNATRLAYSENAQQVNVRTGGGGSGASVGVPMWAMIGGGLLLGVGGLFAVYKIAKKK